ncbi:MAG TPA: helix-hairpin-helix domain-containing protein [Blastocatellia bacterium]|nr:helix-hairpin-helix domain-containing protein [Blastocatellia bacterium]
MRFRRHFRSKTLIAYAAWILLFLVFTGALLAVASCRQHQPGAQPVAPVQPLSRPPSLAPPEPTPRPPCVDINAAGVEELQKLPGIGKGFAQKIVEYRERYGPFRRPQDLIILNGFGERRYHKLEDFVCVH